MNLDHLHTIDDLRQCAKNRIPKLAFDYLDGGEGDETGLLLNRSAFNDVKLLPHYLRNVAKRNHSVTLFGQRYDFPIGVAPVGLANFIWPGADLMLARLAARHNVPYVISTAGTTKLETIATEIPNHSWFQLYVSADDHVTFDLMRRAEGVGIKVLVVTVDIPVPAKRLRDLRNRFQVPFRLTPAMLFDIASCPAWAWEMVQSGPPDFESMKPYAPPPSEKQTLAEYMVSQSTSGLDVELMKKIRDAWPGKLVVKGVMSADTAVAAADLGADGLVVSNHGGRQLASAPSTIEVLETINQAVGDRMTLMLDSGIRNGGDIAKSLSMGAQFTFSGRSFMYGIGAGGTAGAERAFDILRDELDRTLAQIGCPDVSDLGRENLWQSSLKNR